MGGQTGLNLCRDLEKENFWVERGIKIIGVDIDAVELTEDRQLFRDKMEEIGIEQCKSRQAESLLDAKEIKEELGGLPIVIRPSFTMGGAGGGIVWNEEDFDKLPEDVREDALADIYNGTIKQGMAAHEAGMPLGGGVISQNQTRQRALRTFENTVIGGVFNTFETIARLTAYIAAHRMMQKPDAMESAVNFFNTDADFRGNVNRNGGVATPRMVAQQVLEETFGVYGKLNRPQYMRGWGSAFFLFQTYISQMFSLMTRMLTRQGTPAPLSYSARTV